jgi:hypothetical protein
MNCSKCGGDIRNLPEYIEETGAEVLCSHCAGTEDRSDSPGILVGRSRPLKFQMESGDDLEVAA